MILPETELYELLHFERRRLVTFLRGRPEHSYECGPSPLRQSGLDGIMQAVVRCTKDVTGSYRTFTSADEANKMWGVISGARSPARFAVRGSRQGDVGTRDDSLIGVIPTSATRDIEVDLGTGQMTLQSQHLQALEEALAKLPDVEMLFGKNTIQV